MDEFTMREELERRAELREDELDDAMIAAGKEKVDREIAEEDEREQN